MKWERFEQTLFTIFYFLIVDRLLMDIMFQVLPYMLAVNLRNCFGMWFGELLKVVILNWQFGKTKCTK